MTQPCSSTSARSNGTTSFSTASTSSIVPGSVSNRSLCCISTPIWALPRYVPRDEFRAIVERHQGDKGVRKLSSWGQFVAFFFGQLTGQHSLRDLVTT